MVGSLSNREVLQEFFNIDRFSHPVAVTLTMKKRVGGQSADPISASENFRHFRNRLNAKLLGAKAKRYGAKLQMIAVLECSADARLHYHAIIDRPYYVPFDRFKDAVMVQWHKTAFGYRQIDIQDHADTGWVDYITKSQQKTSLLDSIDWTNCHLIAE